MGHSGATEVASGNAAKPAERVHWASVRRPYGIVGSVYVFACGRSVDADHAIYAIVKVASIQPAQPDSSDCGKCCIGGLLSAQQV
jgi:hypothetical protein